MNRLPGMYVTEDWFWPDVVKGEERIKATQHIFVKLVDMFYLRLVTTFGRAEVGKRDIPLLKYKELLDIVYENGEVKNLSKNLYPFLASKYKLNYCAIEMRLRNSLCLCLLLQKGVNEELFGFLNYKLGFHHQSSS